MADDDGEELTIEEEEQETQELAAEAAADDSCGCGTRECVCEAPREIEPPQAGGRAQLVNYLENIIEKLQQHTPDQDELTETIEPSVVASIKRLTAAAPEEMRGRYKGALEERGVLPGYGADIDAFTEALRVCLALTQDGSPPSGRVAECEECPTPTQQELASLAGVVARLWMMDSPFRLRPGGKDFKLNPQSRAASVDQMVDRCSEPLFQHVDMERLLRNPCSRAFIALLDNYFSDTTKKETYTLLQQREMEVFMQCLMGCAHMRYVHKVLVAWGVVDQNPNKFARKVFDIWFTQYSLRKGGPPTSSGFEHVFVGEEKFDRERGEKTVIGMHNWIRFYLAEKAGHVDYRGFVGSGHGGDRLATVRFSWDGEDRSGTDELKDCSTFIVGSSVAFEFAMLTVAFLGFEGECNVWNLKFGKQNGNVGIKTYPWTTRVGTCVRTAYLST